MKTFQIKQKMWSFGGKFAISDDLGLPCYEVEGSLLKIPKNFTIRDQEGQEVSRIEKQVMTFLPKFDVTLADGSAFCLKKEFTLFKPRYQLENLAMTVEGDFWDMNFTLSRDSQKIAQISQEWLRMTSTYTVEVYDEAYSDLVISLVIAIDYVKELESYSN